MKCRPSTVLIGANNHGKSNILLALEFLLSPAAKPSADDLFAFHEAGDVDLWVEGTFGDLTGQERTTFAKYVRPDGTMRVRKTAHGGDVGYRGYIQQPDIPWMKPEAVEALLERPALDLTDLKQYAPPSGKLTRKQVTEAQEKYLQQNRDKIPFVEVLETTPFLGTKNVAGGLLPDLYLVPAVRDLSVLCPQIC
jgi:putative ATP-dependent endonuclease of the OLD family